MSMATLTLLCIAYNTIWVANLPPEEGYNGLQIAIRLRATPIIQSSTAVCYEYDVLSFGHLKTGSQCILDAEQILQQELAQSEEVEKTLIRVQPQVVLRNIGERDILQMGLLIENEKRGPRAEYKMSLRHAGESVGAYRNVHDDICTSS